MLDSKNKAVASMEIVSSDSLITRMHLLNKRFQDVMQRASSWEQVIKTRS